MIQNQQHRRESTEKKILIPLNEESSEEEDDDISLSSNDLIETRKDQPLQVWKYFLKVNIAWKKTTVKFWKLLKDINISL